MERVLVTGCAGFIGHHLVKELIKRGYSVVGVDDFSTGLRGRLSDFNQNFTFIEGDLCDPEIVQKSVQGVEGIFHLAAIPSVPRSVEEPLKSMHSTVTASLSLYIAARDAGVKRIVQASSSAVYGDTPGLPKREDMQKIPLSPYGAAKLAVDIYAPVFCSCYRMDIVGLRYFNVFGPGQSPEGAYAAVIPKFILAMLKGEQPHVNGDGSNSRSFTYVDNVVHANLLAMSSSSDFHGEVFNISGTHRITLLQLISMLNSLLKTKIVPIFEKSRVGDIAHSDADIRMAEEKLGYSQSVSFEDGLKRTVNYFRSIS